MLFDRLKNTVYVANCGDSRSVLSRNGKAVDLSEDHTPDDEREVERIEAAGGHVTEEGRINGCLNLSRALGDLRYKTNRTLNAAQQIISGHPDVVKCVLKPIEDQYLILMCDGITGSLTNQETVELVHERISLRQRVSSVGSVGSDGGESSLLDVNGDLLSRVCGDVCDYCVAPDIDESEDGSGCDNETFMVIRIDRLWNTAAASDNSTDGVVAESQKQDLEISYQPVVVELPPLKDLSKRKASVMENDDSNDPVESSNKKRRKM